MSAPELTSVVIVGHVDHGKSTFIGRLLLDTQNLSADRLEEIKKASEEHGRRLEYAYVTDQFVEEREKNITIDTSQIFLKIDGRDYLIVDAPGHKEYLKNMITGATQAHNGIIMLDVNEGIREQTEKHARILKLLSVRHISILVNKMDMVEFSQTVFKKYETDLRALMKEIGLDPKAIIPISAYNGDNVVNRSDKMPWYTGPTALDFLVSCGSGRAALEKAHLRFPVQVMFDLDGKKLAMGRVEQGKVEPGQKLTVFPTGEEVQVADVMRHKEASRAAVEGDCVALAMKNGAKIERGHVLTDDKVKAAGQVGVHIFWAAPEPLRPGDELIVECRTQAGRFEVVNVADEIEDTKISQLASGDVGQITLKAKDKILIDAEPEGAALSRLVFHKNGQVAGCGVVSHVD